MALGRLRHRLVLEEAATAEDGSGGFATTWTTVASVWGAIETLAGREVAAGDAVKGEASHRVTIRYRDDAGPAKRLRFGARIFEIKSAIDPDQRKRVVVCHCVERT